MAAPPTTRLPWLALCSAALAALIIALGCDSDERPGPDAGGPDDAGAETVDSGTRDAGVRSDGGALADAGTDAGVELPSRDLRCRDEPPAGSVLPPPLPPYSGGTCPTLTAGRNTIRSGGADREFLLVLPSDMAPGERLPVVVMWHYLAGNANSMFEHGQAQESADSLRFIAAIPEKKGDLAVDLFVAEFDPDWPYLDVVPEARVEEEAIFFDDMVTCIAEQYTVNESCISTTGVSAGALWSAQLMQRRSERLASVILLSGGVGPATMNGFVNVRGWAGSAHAMPVLLGWGGVPDQCGVDFDRASRNLGAHLAAEGHFVEECIHNCGHAAPPVDPALGLPLLWSFAVDHPYWLRDGESPYLAAGLPENNPSWCAIGVGAATPRTGTCMGDGFDGMSCPVPAL